MTNEELKKWAKTNRLNRPEGMSDKDYELNMNRENALSQQGLLDQNLQNQQTAIKSAQKTAQQSASVSQEKLLKYIGQNQMASGVAAGQRGSDYINANNAYVQNRGAIANTSAQAQSDLLNSYASQKLQNEQNELNRQTSILDKYRELDLVNEDRQSSKDLEWIATAQEALGGTGMTYGIYERLLGDQEELTSEDKERFIAEIEKYRSRMSEESFEKLMSLYSGLLYSK